MAAKKKSTTTSKKAQGSASKKATKKKTNGTKVTGKPPSPKADPRGIPKALTKAPPKTAKKASPKTENVGAKPNTGTKASPKIVKKASPKTGSVGAKPTAKPRATMKVGRKTSNRSRASRSAEASAMQAETSSELVVGDTLPDFALLDQHGNTVSAEQLRGSDCVLYFYPKDDTPGCTKQACGFNEELERFDALGVRVVGVSPDSQSSHQRFASKYGLKFTLLSDPQHTLARACGVYALKKNYGREYMGIVRTTFLIGAGGKVERVWRGVRVAGHVPEVLESATG